MGVDSERGDEPQPDDTQVALRKRASYWALPLGLLVALASLLGPLWSRLESNLISHDAVRQLLVPAAEGASGGGVPQQYLGAAEAQCSHYVPLYVGLKHVRSDQLDAALKQVRTVPICEGEMRRVLLKRFEGGILGSLKRHDEAIEVWLSIGDFASIVGRADEAKNEGLWDTARLYLQALGRQREQVDVATGNHAGVLYMDLGRHYASVNQTEDALRAFEEASAWASFLYIDAVLNRAVLLSQTGRNVEAIELVADALPGTTAHTWNRFKLLRQLGLLWEASAHPEYAYCAFRAALDLVPKLHQNLTPEFRRAELTKFLARVSDSAERQRVDCVQLEDAWQATK